MQQYINNKIISIGIPVLLMLFGTFVWSGQVESYWWFLIIFTMILGHTHFLLGFQYQFRHLLKQQNSKKGILIFFFLVVFSIIFCTSFILNGMYNILDLIMVSIFILHGTLNENTMIEEHTKYSLPILVLLFTAVGNIALFFTSLPHRSVFFTPFLDFIHVPRSIDLLSIIWNYHIKYEHVLIGMFTLFVLLGIYTYLKCKKYRKFVVITALVISAASLVSLSPYGPLNYVYLLLLYLTYHFITWSIFMYHKIKNYTHMSMSLYMYRHVYMVIIILFLIYIGQSNIEVPMSDIFKYLASSYMFATMAMLHIITALMNEKWFKNIFKI